MRAWVVEKRASLRKPGTQQKFESDRPHYPPNAELFHLDESEKQAKMQVLQKLKENKPQLKDLDFQEKLVAQYPALTLEDINELADEVNMKGWGRRNPFRSILDGIRNKFAPSPKSPTEVSDI